MSDYETSQRYRNITVGIFVLLALCSLVWLVFVFNDLPSVVTEIRSFQVSVKFPTAQGIQVDTTVQFCGYPIGRVTNISPPEPTGKDEKNRPTCYQTKCVLSIDKQYKTIPQNVDIKIMTRGLGSSYIELRVDRDREMTPYYPDKPESIYLAHGMDIQGFSGGSNEFIPENIQKKMEDLIDGITALAKNANDIIGDQANKDNLKQSMKNLTDLTAKATVAVEDFQKFMGTTNEAAEELSLAVSEIRLIAEKINSGKGTAGMFINDGRLYENLLENTDQLQVFIQDLKDLVAEYRKKGIKVKL